MKERSSFDLKMSESTGLRRWVHVTLLAGVTLSGILLIVGLIVTLAHGHPQPVGTPPSLAAVLHHALEGNGVAVMRLGLLILMATPVARVAILAVGWAAAKNWRFALACLVVLALLGLSLALGLS